MIQIPAVFWLMEIFWSTGIHRGMQGICKYIFVNTYWKTTSTIIHAIDFIDTIRDIPIIIIL